MIGQGVKVIEYSKKVDFFNALTHGTGAALSIAAAVVLILKTDNERSFISALIYGLSLVAVYSVSTVYHALPVGEAKRIARLADHSTVPILFAGTATPCALITLCNISFPHGIAVLLLGWGCTAFGIISKIFFFEKSRLITVPVYIVSGIFMLAISATLLNRMDSGAFTYIVLGNVFYVIGAICCGLGIKREWFHVIFHVFVLIASAIHFATIFFFVI